MVDVLRMRVDKLERELQEERIEKASLKSTVKSLESSLRMEELKNKRQSEEELIYYNPLGHNSIWSTDDATKDENAKRKSYLGRAV